MIGKTNKGGGGSLSSLVNGSKKKYYAYAGQNIKKGDFTTYLWGVAGVGAGTTSWRQASAGATYNSEGYAIAERIDENRVLIVCREQSVNTGTLCAKVVTYDGVEVQIGASALLDSFMESPVIDYIKVAVLSSTKAVVIKFGSSAIDVYAQVITISGNTVSVGARQTVKIIGAPSGGYTLFDARARMFLYATSANTMSLIFVRTASSTYDTYAMLFSISGDTVSTYNVAYLFGASELNSTSVNMQYAIVPGTNRLVGFWNSGTVIYGRSIILPSVPGQDVVLSSTPQLSANLFRDSGTQLEILPVSEYQSIVVGRDSINASGVNLHIITFAPDFSSFTLVNSGKNLPGLKDALYSRGYKYRESPIVGENKVLFSYEDYNNYSNPTHFVVMQVSGNTINIGGVLNIASPGSSNNMEHQMTVSLVGSKVAIFNTHYNNSIIYTMLLNAPGMEVETLNYIYELQVRKATNNQEIEGIAIEDALGGTSTGAGATHNQACDVISITSP